MFLCAEIIVYESLVVILVDLVSDGYFTTTVRALQVLFELLVD